MRIVAAALSAFGLALLSAPGFAQLDPLSAAAPVQSDAQWLAQVLLPNAMRDARMSELRCLTRVMLASNEPRGGISKAASNASSARESSGLADDIRQAFVEEWIGARATLARQLASYQQTQQLALRSFFESPTGQKYIRFSNLEYVDLPKGEDTARGLEQCRPKIPDGDAFDQAMDDDDIQHFAEFRTGQLNQLSPTFAMSVAGQLGMQVQEDFFGRFRPKFEMIVRREDALSKTNDPANSRK